MNITDVNNKVKGHKRRKRIGRGAASGHGKTAGRGQKGLGSRSGPNYLKGFIGGQTSLMTRLPKRGFNNANFRVEYIPLNLTWLEKTFAAGDTVGVEQMEAHGVKVGRKGKVKILAQGTLTKALQVSAHAFSKSAAEKITAAGGTVTVLESGDPAEKKADA